MGWVVSEPSIVGGLVQMDYNWDRGFALEQASGDEDLLRELLTIFAGTVVVSRQKIEEALVMGDVSKVGQTAHSVKGAASSLGFAEIAELANMIEARALDGDISQAPKFLARLEILEETLPRLA